jgi:acyl-CoA reductase-like NAD-dependent aldehyde dehydrogenase
METTAIISRQREFFLSGATASEKFRRARLHELQDALTAHESPLLDALHADLRKSRLDAYASEVGFVLGDIRHTLRHLHQWMKPQRRKAPWLAWPASGEVRREPFGVALIIGPWNYPLQLLLAPLVSAIAAGNTAVLKPSELAPHTSAAVAQMIRRTFRDDFVTVIEGGRQAAESLLSGKFDKIFFTGGTQIGREVMAAAARNLTPVTLELGGKSPCIVTADVPLATTARRIAWGKFMNAGQTCVAPDFLLVHRSISVPLVDALKSALHEFYGDDPQRSADYGRIINERHFNRLGSLLDQGKILHGGCSDAADLYIEPTLIGDVSRDSPLMQDEIFGPILPVIEYDHIDEVLATLRAQPLPLALYLFTMDRALREKVLSGTRSGGVCINDTLSHILGRDLPFGGVGDSGMGSYHGRAGFECFSHARSVLRRTMTQDPKFRYPPPKASLHMMRKIMRWFG